MKRAISPVVVVAILVSLGTVAYVSSLIGGAKTAPGPPAPLAKTRTSTLLPTTGNHAHDLLIAMSSEARASTFGNITRAHGEPCGKITATFFGGMTAENEAVWSVACSDGHNYQITINDVGGSSTIVSCARLTRVVVKLACFVELKQQ